jgi:hypothetical protein
MSENTNTISPGEGRLFANTVKQGLAKPTRLARPFARNLYRWLRDVQKAEEVEEGLAKGRITYCFQKLNPNQVRFEVMEKGGDE